MYTSELEGNLTIGLRAFENSNDDVRCSVAKYLARLLASVNTSSKAKAEEVLNYLSQGFLHDIQTKKSTTLLNEVRIGIVYVRTSKKNLFF